MKIRQGFVSNSSSSSFIITNKTNKTLNIVDFVMENPHLIEDFKEYYDWYKDDPNFTQEQLIVSAINNNKSLVPGENEVVFGDEDDTLIGQVFDYQLRGGGHSASFRWKFHESRR